MVTLKWDKTTAVISEVGAELKSLRVAGTEYIWQGDPEIWAGSSPLLFPICSGLKDDEYILDGKKYHLDKHGFARFRVFQVESYTDSTAVFLLKSDKESKNQFPFDYELRVIYSLCDRKLDVKYEVKNLSEDTMYFSIGAHEGYACPEGIEEYDVIFPEDETLYASVLEGNLIGKERQLILEKDSVLPLRYDYFAVDALVFKSIRARSAVLKNRNTGRQVKLTFEGFDYFLLWTKPGAPYLCMEPWCGISDNTDTDQNFKTKEGIESLAKNAVFSRLHTIEIL